MEALGQGKLRIEVLAKNAPQLKISGLIVPRFSCDIFDSVLSTLSEDGSEDMIHNEAARGLAWMTMDKFGLINYNINWKGLSEDPISIQIDNGRKSQRLLRIVHEMDFQGQSLGLIS